MPISRLKSYLLSNVDDRLYYKNKLFDGIVFFEKANFQLEVFEVENGKITKPYISPCQLSLYGLIPSNILIDSSTFCCDDEDIHDSGAIPQLYQGKPYHGMSYTFIDGKCDREIYTDESGEIDSKIVWNVDNYEPKRVEIQHYLSYPATYCYFYNKISEISFSYQCNESIDNRSYISITYDASNEYVSNLELAKNELFTKNYLDSSIYLSKVFDLLKNFDKFKFYSTKSAVGLGINPIYINDLFLIWIKNGAFSEVSSLSVDGIEGIKDLTLFNNKTFFSNLKTLYLPKNVTEKIINKLKSTCPDYDIIII